MAPTKMNQDNHKNYPSTITLENFSSTTKLANHDITASVAENKESINEKGDYKPFENRPTEHANTVIGSITHLLKSSLGTGILAMPNAFKNGGLVFSAVGTLVVGLICAYCVHILVKVSHELCERIKVPSLGFSETCEAAFEYGPKQFRKVAGIARIIVDTALVFTYFMSNCVYVVFIAESIEQLVDHWVPGHGLAIHHFMLIIMAGLLITCQVRELKHLVPYSFFANIFMVISFSISLYYMFIDIPSPSDKDLVFSKVTNLPIFFSTVIFAMEGIGVVMPVENSMKKPQHFLGCPGVLTTVMSIVVVLYSVIGFFGYLKYGDLTDANITKNFPVEEIPAQIVKLFIALAIFFTYNLQFYVPIDIIWRKVIEPRANSKIKIHIFQVILRCVFVIGTAAVAIAVPHLEPIIGLVGSVCFSTLGLLIPSVVETVWRWDSGLGKYNWVLIKNVLLSVFSIFALISGSARSIVTLINT